MAHVYDVAAYVFERQGAMTAMKLHKLLYYCQAWHLVWDEEPLFDAKIEAWREGPVVPVVYELHKGSIKIREWPAKGGAEDLESNERETIDAVLDAYGSWSAYKLSQQTHEEAPWKEVRQGYPSNARSGAEITHVAMYEYYASLVGAT